MSRRAWWLRLSGTGLSLGVALACGSIDSNNRGGSAPNGDFGTVEPTTPGAESPTEPALPPEQERESSFRAPVVTGRYVWSANPESGRVAAIDAETYEIRSAEAGFRPTHVAAVNQADGVPRALVINVGSNDATLLTLPSAGAIQTRSVPLHQGADSWSVGPGGRVAIAWTDSRKAEQLDPTDGFQDITVIELPEGGEPVATRLTVGYRPSAFAFDAAGTRAYGITEDGISVVELEPGAIRLSRLVELPSPGGLQPDVSVTPDGSRALARLEQSSVLFDIDLMTGQRREIDLGGELTDLDLSEDGSRAVAVIRSGATAPADPGDAGALVDAGALNDAGALDAGALDGGVGDGGVGDGAPPAAPAARSRAIIIPVPAGLSDSAQRQTYESPSVEFGSVALSQDGSRAVLFTTARSSGRVTLLGPELEARSVDLLAAVHAVFVTANGAHAIVLQEPAPGSVRKGAFSVLSLESVRAPKLVAADAPAEAVALSAEHPERAVVTVSDPESGTFGAFLVRTPNLQVDFSSLPSRPLATGSVPTAAKAFVAQQHPEGRITFIELSDGQSREITGFELSSEVVTE